MANQTALRHTFPVLALSLSALPAWAEDTGRFDIGAHLGTMLGDGEPANDMPGYGIYGLYRLNDRWSFGLGIDRTEFDYEELARILGIPPDPNDPPVDQKAEMAIKSALIERPFNPSRKGGSGSWARR